ncbi:MAG: type VI secretion system tip protein VgrG [Planctomycetota bacterium]
MPGPLLPMFTHASRLLNVKTPLGEDVLLLEGMEGSETFSRGFEYRLDLLSHEEGIDPLELVGKTVTFQIFGDGDATRSWNGVVRRLARGGLHPSGMRSYQALVVPWTWFLTKRSNCRIFQEMSVVDIVSKVFDDAGFSDGYETSGITGSYPVLNYCVQYRETDLEFVSRLLEEEGIFYSFRHEDGRHVLVLADGTSAYAPCDQAEVPYNEGSLASDHVSRWVHGFEYVSGKWSHTDYNFETPRADLHAETPTVLGLSGVDAHERYDYPGRYVDKSHGDTKAKALMEAEEAGHDVVEGASTCSSFCVGGTFTLSGHAYESEDGKSYVLTGVQHSAHDGSYVQSGGGSSHYRNSFRCIPDSVVVRPKRLTRRPLVHGPQTAVVVGPSGDEIYTDEFGRIKVQFHWDREGASDENSSCWVRVAQIWAGKAWGAQYIPRIGQEVVVEFLEGDPDRPLVTGGVYNGDMPVPYDLPANKTQSGIKSRSSKEGGTSNFNELRFEDKKGEELVYIHAEKDRREVVENDHALNVGHDQAIEVGNDRSEKIGNDRSLSVGANKSETVGETKSVTVGKTHTESIGTDMSVSVGDDRTLEVGSNLSEVVGSNHVCSVGEDATIDVGNALTISTGKTMETTVGTDRTLTVAKESSHSAKKIMLTADDELILKVGKASLVMKKNGDITLKGKKITVKGSGDVVLKGSKIAQN